MVLTDADYVHVHDPDRISLRSARVTPAHLHLAGPRAADAFRSWMRAEGMDPDRALEVRLGEGRAVWLEVDREHFLRTGELVTDERLVKLARPAPWPPSP